MKPIKITAQLFNGEPGNLEWSRRTLTWIMFGMAQACKDWLLAHPNFPALYDTNVRYAAEKGTENWQDIATTYARGIGDCEDLAIWRIAELNARGIQATPYITWGPAKAGGGVTYHALVRWPNGTIEDPSRALGMHGHPMVRRPVFIGIDA